MCKQEAYTRCVEYTFNLQTCVFLVERQCCTSHGGLLVKKIVGRLPDMNVHNGTYNILYVCIITMFLFYDQSHFLK
jgi:hypothetical protein